MTEFRRETVWSRGYPHPHQTDYVVPGSDLPVAPARYRALLGSALEANGLTRRAAKEKAALYYDALRLETVEPDPDAPAGMRATTHVRVYVNGTLWAAVDDPIGALARWIVATAGADEKVTATRKAPTDEERRQAEAARRDRDRGHYSF